MRSHCRTAASSRCSRVRSTSPLPPRIAEAGRAGGLGPLLPTDVALASGVLGFGRAGFRLLSNTAPLGGVTGAGGAMLATTLTVRERTGWN
ncbi:hypothetical protein BN1263310021 [Stenotrophomonas thermophila]|nr:hypothetical protein BN1263310021 [Stenotrophomonas maltophilia]